MAGARLRVVGPPPSIAAQAGAVLSAYGGLKGPTGRTNFAQEAAVEEHFVWVTTRRLQPGTLDEFERAWRPAPYPQGLSRAYAYWSEDGVEITGVSFWESKEACDSWRASEPEKRRRAAMAPYVVEEREGFYRGRELGVPQRQ